MLNKKHYLLVTLLALMMFSSGLWPNVSRAQSPLPIDAQSPSPAGEPQEGKETNLSLSPDRVTGTLSGQRLLFPGLFDDVWTPSAVTPDVDGSIHFVAEIFVEGQPEVYYVKAKNDLVLEIVNLSQNPSSSMHPDLYVSDTEVHVVWQDNLSGTDQVYHRWRSEGQWVAAQPVTDSPSGAYAPKLIAEQDEQIQVEWIEYTQNQTDAYRCAWTGARCAGRVSVNSLPQAPEPLSTEATEALRTLAFLRDGEIWTVQEDGSGLRRVTNSGGRVYAFAWSPDGQQFAYTYLTDLEYQLCDIYVINLDGSAERRLTTNIGASRWVIDWRGDKIAFLREMTEYPYVRITSVTTNGIVTDISGDIENYGIGFNILSHPRLRWSPNGQWIALSHGMANAAVSLGGLQRLIDEWLQPDWNKDSTHLIYDSGKIRKYYPATGSSTLLSSVAPDFPTYSPDNQYIVYGSPSLRRMNNNNTGNVSLTSDKAAFMDWSHLGDKIAYTRWYDNGTPWAGIYGVYVIGYSGSGRRQVSSGDDESPRWQPQVASYSVSGRVTSHSGSGISGVTISTDKGQTVITDANGNYTLSGIGAGSYTIIPANDGFIFAPVSRVISVPPDATGVDFTAAPCATMPSGLDTCALQAGDILLKTGPTFGECGQLYRAVFALGGTYFTHSALYLGQVAAPGGDPNDIRPRIAEAQGYHDDDAYEVWETWLDATQFATGQCVSDWVVVRPSASTNAINGAITYARQKAAEAGVVFDMYATKSDPKKFYCSKLVWKSYLDGSPGGPNLEADRGVGNYTFGLQYVTPDDLFYSSPIVQEMAISPEQAARRGFFYIWSPGHLTLIDPLGRRVGYDPVTGGTFAEIADAAYFAPPGVMAETITARGIGSDWQIVVTGFGTGSYSLESGYADRLTRRQLLLGTTYPGKSEIYPVHEPVYVTLLPLMLK